MSQSNRITKNKMYRHRLTAIFVYCASLFLCQSPEALVKRHILALYAGSECEDIAFHPLHLYAELPMNHLGYILRYWDIEKGFPSPADIRESRGIVTWFLNGRIKDPLAYIKWATNAIENGTKFLILGNIGVEENLKAQSTSFVNLNILLKAIGIERKESWINPHQIQKFILEQGNNVNFERRLDRMTKGFNLQNILSSEGRSIVSVELKDGLTSDLVVVTPRGGIATEGYFLYAADETSLSGKNDDLSAKNTKPVSQWYINPFSFFGDIFEGQKLPKPDVTTLCGNRIFFNHIEGVGWGQKSEIELYKKSKLSTMEVIYNDLLLQHPELPVTIGPIMGDLDPNWVGNAKNQEIARKIFDLPYVEAASHSYSLPESTKYFLKNQSLEDEKKDFDRGLTKRLYMNQTYSSQTEFKESVDYMKQFLPENKKVSIFLWTGDCLPSETELEIIRLQHIQNLNGGRNRFDAEYPSYSSLSPYARQVGPYLQIYAAGSNDNNYTYGWKERFFGLKFLTTTLINTDRPIRLKPINLYYTALSGLKKSSIMAIEEVFDYLKNTPIHPIFASDYAAIVRGFYSTEINALDSNVLGENSWEILNRGKLQTIRFDQASFQKLDLQKSKGVLGAKHIHGSLYVSLDPSDEKPIIALTDMKTIELPPRSTQFYLLESHWQISNLHENQNQIEFNLSGFGSGKMRYYCPQKGKYNIVVEGETQNKEIERIVSEDKILSIPLDFTSKAEAKVKITKKDI
jgi:hypothetical protein